MAITDITHRLLADIQVRAASLNRPVVTMSYAQSFDGSLTSRRGATLFLSCAESKLMTHQLRAAHSAILVGIGTVLADDPRLTARLSGGVNPQPVILDRMLRIPVESRLLARSDCMPWIVCGPKALPERRDLLERMGARVIVVDLGEDGRINLKIMLSYLYQYGHSSLMVEGGARVIHSFLRQRLVDQAVVTVAPVWIGGIPAVDGFLGDADSYPQWDQPVIEQLGRDWVVWGKLGEGNYETASPVYPGT
jgi:diaminohydroxyphosphoribosylaminopyrimidine deaminase / 5-amino-6-(5-phosphoribosylamino)uracil reductase